MAERGAAPADVVRNHAPGTLRAAVRPHYEGPPFGGLDAGRMKEGESPPDQGGCRTRLSGPGSYGPGVRNRRDGALSGARLSQQAPALQGAD